MSANKAAVSVGLACCVLETSPMNGRESLSGSRVTEAALLWYVNQADRQPLSPSKTEMDRAPPSLCQLIHTGENPESLSGVHQLHIEDKAIEMGRGGLRGASYAVCRSQDLLCIAHLRLDHILFIIYFSILFEFSHNATRKFQRLRRSILSTQ